jgi:maleamate amidohydrolase
MADDFENHCWKDIISPDVLDIYAHYARKTFIGPSPALLATTWRVRCDGGRA